MGEIFICGLSLEVLPRPTDNNIRDRLWGHRREFQHGDADLGLRVRMLTGIKGGPDADSLPKHLSDDAEKLTKQKNHVVFSFCSGSQRAGKEDVGRRLGHPHLAPSFVLDWSR